MCVCAKSLQSCPTLCNHMDYSLPGSSVHGILQARGLEWVAISFSRGSSQPGWNPRLLCLLHWQEGSLPLSHLRSPILGVSESNLKNITSIFGASLLAHTEKQEPRARSLGRGDPLEKETATRSSILAWRIPWTEEPGGLQSTVSQRVRHYQMTNTSSLTSSVTGSPTWWQRFLGPAIRAVSELGAGGSGGDLENLFLSAFLLLLCMFLCCFFQTS